MEEMRRVPLLPQAQPEIPVQWEKPYMASED